MKRCGRNHLCPCGSGKKYKRCCLKEDQGSGLAAVDREWQEIRGVERFLAPLLLSFATSKLGPESVVQAWDEFSFYQDLSIEEPEFDTIFPSWFLFRWDPRAMKEDSDEDFTPAHTISAMYLAEEHSSLNEYQKRFLQKVSQNHHSFFVVIEGVPGQSLRLFDLFLQQERIVKEALASQTLERGTIVFTSVLSLDGQSIMVGLAPRTIPARFSSATSIVGTCASPSRTRPCPMQTRNTRLSITSRRPYR
jgi:hypothetical protein